MIRQQKRQYEREPHDIKAAIYAAPAAYGDEIDMKEALDKCIEYIKQDESLRLMRIYRDDKAEVIRGNYMSNRRTVLTAVGVDAWNKLLADLTVGAVEAVVFYSARMIAPTFCYTEEIARRFFFLCGIRFADVSAGFDSVGHTADEAESMYFKLGRSAYRSSIVIASYKKRKKERHEL